jgi:hypothetical protein
MSYQRKTQKKVHDEGEMTKFSQFLDDTVTNAFKRPWHRLERGLRLNRIRQFVTEEKEKMNLSAIEMDNLLLLLQKGLDKKLLNSKSTIIYDIDNERIVEIKGLVSHRGADGLLTFQIIEKKSGGVTLKKRSNSIV